MCKLAKLSVCRILALVRLTGSTEVGSELHNDEAVNDRIYNPYKRYFYGCIRVLLNRSREIHQIIEFDYEGFLHIQ